MTEAQRQYYKQKLKDNDLKTVVKELIDSDFKSALEKFDLDKLYIIELSSKWIDKNANEISIDDLKKKLDALNNIIKDSKFLEAVEDSDYAYRLNKIDNDELKVNRQKNAEQLSISAANLVTSIVNSDEYKKNSKDSGYKILKEYESPEFHKENSLYMQKQTLEKMYNYLNEKVDYIKKNLEPSRESNKNPDER